LQNSRNGHKKARKGAKTSDSLPFCGSLPLCGHSAISSPIPIIFTAKPHRKTFMCWLLRLDFSRFFVPMIAAASMNADGGPDAITQLAQLRGAEPAAELIPVKTNGFNIICRRPEDRITIKATAGQTIFSVTSPSGIGGATITRQEARWPKEIILRFHLRGLEDFRISNGLVEIGGAVASHSGHAVRLHLKEKGKEGPPLTRENPFWTEITRRDADGRATEGLPKEGGYFEMKLPPALLNDQTKRLTLSWIDFYR
jgi:hypothetical protein